MAANIYRDKRHHLVWESESCQLSFEGPAGRGPAVVSREDLVGMEGDLDLARLDQTLDQALAELNQWLAKP